MNGIGAFGIVVAVLLAIGMIVAGAAAAQRKLRAAVDALFAEHGFVLVRKPEQSARDAVWPIFAAFKHLKHGAKGIQWIARGQVEGREVVAIQHSYTIHTGQSAQQIVHVCVACPCPAHWPMVELRGEHVFHRIASALGSSDIELESEAFNKRWRISSESEEQAILVLTPEVQEMLTGAPAGEAWSIGRGWVRLSGRNLVKPRYLYAGLRRPGRLLEGVPPELFADVPPATT